MGGSVSRGNDNQDLINKLKEAKLVRTFLVERVLRLVDRADYFLPNYRTQAYVDSAWREGRLHISAPCIYCEVLEQLELKPGNTFLNIGSGTGYLNTLVGLLIGSRGINHGIEFYPENVTYAEECLTNFLINSDAVFERDFCPPQFTCANIFRLAGDDKGDDGGPRLYDRIYCGAKVDEDEPIEMIKSMLALGGVLVAPVNDKLKKITRVSWDTYDSAEVMTVAFASLLEPSPSEPFTARLPPLPEIASLQMLSIRIVQGIFRENIKDTKGKLPDLKRIHYTAVPNPNDDSDENPDPPSPSHHDTLNTDTLPCHFSARSSTVALRSKDYQDTSSVASSAEDEVDEDPRPISMAMDVETTNEEAVTSTTADTEGQGRQDSECSGLGTSVDTGGCLEATATKDVTVSSGDEGGEVDSDDSGTEEMMLPLRLLKSVYHRHTPQVEVNIREVDEEEERDHERDLAAARAFRNRLLHLSQSNSSYDSDGEAEGGMAAVAQVVADQEYLFREEMALIAGRLPIPPALRSMLTSPPVAY